MPNKVIKESYMDDRNSNWQEENNALKADEETVTRASKDGLVVSDSLKSTYPETPISKILRNSVYGLTTSSDKAMASTSSIVPTKSDTGSVLTEVKTKVESLLTDVEFLKSKIDELEQENKLLRSRADKVDAENEELYRRDAVLERHISELKLKFML